MTPAAAPSTNLPKQAVAPGSANAVTGDQGKQKPINPLLAEQLKEIKQAGTVPLATQLTGINEKGEFVGTPAEPPATQPGRSMPSSASAAPIAGQQVPVKGQNIPASGAPPATTGSGNPPGNVGDGLRKDMAGRYAASEEHFLKQSDKIGQEAVGPKGNEDPLQQAVNKLPITPPSAPAAGAKIVANAANTISTSAKQPAPNVAPSAEPDKNAQPKALNKEIAGISGEMADQLTGINEKGEFTVGVNATASENRPAPINSSASAAPNAPVPSGPVSPPPPSVLGNVLKNALPSTSSNLKRPSTADEISKANRATDADEQSPATKQDRASGRESTESEEKDHGK